MLLLLNLGFAVFTSINFLIPSSGCYSNAIHINQFDNVQFQVSLPLFSMLIPEAFHFPMLLFSYFCDLHPELSVEARIFCRTYFVWIFYACTF